MFPFYATLGVLEELDATEMGASSYYENLLDAFTYDGKIYAIPKDVSTLAMYVNTDLLESCGYTVADIPESLEEMVTFLPELQEKLDETYGANQIAAMTYNQDLARNLHLLERGGASVVDDEGYSTLSSEGVLTNLDFMLSLVDTGAYKTPADLGLGWNGEVFGTGKCVIMEEGNWVYGTLVQNYSDINFTVIDMPSYLGEKSSMSFTVGYGIYNQSDNIDLAKEWIKYATGEGMATWCSGAGCLPSRADIAELMDVESDPVWATHLAQVDYAVPWQKGTTISIVNTAYQNYLPTIISGEATAADAMAKADKQANDEIANSQ
jgi:multiple sugar transport system substrate-binding protein